MDWILLLGALGALLLIDLLLVRGGRMSLRAAIVASVVWTLLGLGFYGVLLVTGDDRASAYLAGYLVERALSLDNVFVFFLVFTAFGIPDAARQRLLTWGILGALVLRAICIVAGAAALEAVPSIQFVFAAFLIWTGWRMWQARHDHGGEQAQVARLRERLKLTPAAAALVAIALLDLLFAIDSVPAILAITTDTLIVFAANAFALLGLRPLFTLVAELVTKLRHLKGALAVLLVFIGGKAAAAGFGHHVEPHVSRPVIAAILAAGVVASLAGGGGRRRPQEA
jgi:tellurite resistance protein TerC